MKFSFYSIFQFDNDGICISFPDIPSCLTCAYDEDEAIKMATEALELCLHGTKIDNIPVMTASNFINLEANQRKVKIDVELEVKSGRLFSSKVIDFK